jgi:anti-sigma factor RsiW
MSECMEFDLRDDLPRFALDALEPAAAETVRTHLAGCASCQAELALLRTARRLAEADASTVDVGRIVTAVAEAQTRGASPAPLRLVRTKPRWASRGVLAAAASVVLMVSVALPVWRRDASTAAADTRRDTAVVGAAGNAAGVVAVPVEGGLESLSDADLSALLGVLDGLEATPVAEPTTLGTPIVDVQEVP